MKIERGALGRSVDQPSPDVRLYLFHGPDEAGSRALGERVRKALGAEKQALAGAALRADPALLAAEAGAISMFGGRTLLWVEPAGDEITQAVTALLDAPACENPVVAIGGTLRKTSSLLKLAEAHSRALAQASYVPEGRDADRLAMELAREEGMVLSPDLARRVAEAAGNNRDVMAREVEKIALFVGAAPGQARPLAEDEFDAIAVGMEGDSSRLVDLALSGEVQRLATELARLAPASAEAIPILRSLHRRLLQLAPLRAKLEAGTALDAAMASAGNALFWKDKPLIRSWLARWPSSKLAVAEERASQLEQRLMLSPLPEMASVGELLLDLARVARRRSG